MKIRSDKCHIYIKHKLQLLPYNISESRHAVLCQWPRKQKKTLGTQVCYLLVAPSFQIYPSVSPKLLSQFLPNLYMFYITYTILQITKLKEIALTFLEMFVPEDCQFPSHFSSSYKITNIFKSHENNLSMFKFFFKFGTPIMLT